MNIKTCPLCEKKTCGCDQLQDKQYDIATITTDSLNKKIQSTDNLMLINVLNKPYYTDCHIKNSINIPLGAIEKTAQKWDENKAIVVYCANYMCTASDAAWKILHNMGFKNIFCYKGGIKEWKEKKLLTEGPCLLPYLKQ